MNEDDRIREIRELLIRGSPPGYLQQNSKVGGTSLETESGKLQSLTPTLHEKKEPSEFQSNTFRYYITFITKKNCSACT